MSSTTSDRSGTSSPVSEGVGAEGIEILDKLQNTTVTEEHGKVMDGGVEEQPGKMVEGDMVEPSPGPSTGATGGIDRLLQKHRNEIMFELRRLQLGERPVTGQGNKEAVESFFTRALNTDGAQHNSEEHRPEEVRVEVNALVQRRPVSSILQSSNFRLSLESALRGALGHLPSPTARAPGPQQVTSRSTDEQSAVSRPVGAPQSQLPIPAPRRLQPRTHHQATIQPRPVVASQTPNIVLPSPPGPTRAQQWLTQHVPAQVDPYAERQATVQDMLQQERREDLIADITELVHRQLVTSSLEGHFRGTLEHLMQDRANGDGERVAELIQNLPSRRVARNDFSNFGILNQALSDDISVISATAAVTVPYAQSNAALSREMGAIKAQLAEMQNMMRMNFDIQLDIQRAIRQEVSAAVHNVMTETSRENGASATVGSGGSVSSVPASENHCLICLEKHVDSVLYQCGHMCVCYACGMNLQTRGSNCPVCRAPIRDIIRAYKCNTDN